MQVILWVTILVPQSRPIRAQERQGIYQACSVPRAAVTKYQVDAITAVHSRLGRSTLEELASAAAQGCAQKVLP